MQNKIVASARQFGKPVVVATQMLESMVTSPTPTRAEVSDVATAIYDGADAVMLSAESAAGQYPVEAVQMMDRIANTVERDPSYPARVHFTQTRLGADDRRCARRLGAADRKHDLRHRHGLLHELRLDRPADCARAAARAAAGHERIAPHLAAPWPAVGRPRRSHTRRRQLRGDGRESQAHGAASPDRQGRRPGDPDGRHPLRHGRLDQRAACRPAHRRRAGPLLQR